MNVKLCLHCNQIKEISLFKKTNTRILDWCYGCCDDYLDKLKTKKDSHKKVITEIGYKYCNYCDSIKKIDEFNKNNQTNDGFTYYCKTCINAGNKKYKTKDYKNKQMTKTDNTKECSECCRTLPIVDFRKPKKQCNSCADVIRCLKLESIVKKNKLTPTILDVKICKVCNEEKPISKFKKNSNYIGGFSHICKICMEANRKCKRNRKKEIAKNKQRMLIDPLYCAKMTIHSNVSGAFKSQNATKNKICKQYGIDIQGIIETIGYKPYKSYQLDHIIPVVVFDLTNDEHVKLCYCSDNLRWIPQKENSEKADTIFWNLICVNDKLLEICELFNITKEFDNKRISDLRKDGVYV